MKKLYNVLLVLSIPALFLLFTAESSTSNGSPGGKTGSPGDGGSNCTDCHAGETINEELWIYSPELLTSGYQSGQTYNIIVVGLSETANKFGFEATAESSNGTKVGTFTPGPMGLNKLINNNKAVTHTLAGTVPLAPEGTSWFFTWMAPATTTGTITFYAAVNTANGNGANTGDQIHLSSFSVSPAVGIAENTSIEAMRVYPNPASDMINIQSENLTGKIDLLNIHGQLVYSTESTDQLTRIDVSGYQKGIYFIRMGSETQRLIVQ